RRLKGQAPSFRRRGLFLPSPLVGEGGRRSLTDEGCERFGLTGCCGVGFQEVRRPADTPHPSASGAHLLPQGEKGAAYNRTLCSADFSVERTKSAGGSVSARTASLMARGSPNRWPWPMATSSSRISTTCFSLSTFSAISSSPWRRVKGAKSPARISG